jgi:hypothetical protein
MLLAAFIGKKKLRRKPVAPSHWIVNACRAFI